MRRFRCASHPFGGSQAWRDRVESQPTSPLEAPSAKAAAVHTQTLSYPRFPHTGGELFPDHANIPKDDPRVSPSLRASLSRRICAPTAPASSRSYGHWWDGALTCWPRARSGFRSLAKGPKKKTPVARPADSADRYGAVCAWQESNLRPRAPEARALSPELQARRGQSSAAAWPPTRARASEAARLRPPADRQASAAPDRGGGARVASSPPPPAG